MIAALQQVISQATFGPKDLGTSEIEYSRGVPTRMYGTFSCVLSHDREHWSGKYMKFCLIFVDLRYGCNPLREGRQSNFKSLVLYINLSSLAANTQRKMPSETSPI